MEEPVLKPDQHIGEYLEEWGFFFPLTKVKLRTDDFDQIPMHQNVEFLVGLLRDDDAYFGILFEYLVQ
jgi:hypothetical protein